MLAVMVNKIRLFSYIFSYSGGAHKSIQGHHTFFNMNHLKTHGQLNDVFAMACGRFTPTQRQIARDRCKVSTGKYINLLTWLIQNHPGYFTINPPTTCPEPTLLGFEISKNNTDVSDGTYPQENIVESVRFSYSPADELSLIHI